MVNLLNGAFNQTQARAIEKFVAEALAKREKAPEVVVKAEVAATKAPKAAKEPEKAAE
jgi:hypothetical protein